MIWNKRQSCRLVSLFAALVALCLALPWSIARADGKGLSEDSALNLIFLRREVKVWTDLVYAADNAVTADLETSPDQICTKTAQPDPSCLWCFLIYEDLVSHRSFFGRYCVDPHASTVLRWNDSEAPPEIVPPNPPFTIEDVLERLPTNMTGWVKWYDQDQAITLEVTWTDRLLHQGLALFEGDVIYHSGDGKTSRSTLFLAIDPAAYHFAMSEQKRAVLGIENGLGKFVGTIDADILAMLGDWEERGDRQRAYFALSPLIQIDQ